MGEKITYSVLEIHARRIRELIEIKKYKNPEDFLKNAIEILLTWESEHPEEVMELMKSLMPFSSEQEGFMKMSMKPDEIQKQFGSLEIDSDEFEVDLQKKLAINDDDHLKLRDNFQHTKNYIEELKIIEPENIIPYDGFPLLSGFYSRFLPVKIVLTVLGHLLERTKESKVELKNLRVQSYDIAEEIAETLSKYERENDIPRNLKKSTGLPKKGTAVQDNEKIAMAQKRFKDQFVGKVRKSRNTKKDHFEGALSALGLVYVFEENNEIFVSLTKLGKDFFLLDNSIIEGEYKKNTFSKLESNFILEKLIPQRELEQKFVDTAISVVKQFQKGSTIPRTLKKDYEKITYALDDEIKKIAIEYIKNNPKVLELYNLNNLESNSETAQRKITQWRLATMGRLAELKIVDWNINDKGDSEYSLN
jgi:Arc/MetJ-type ribon-helix-helix transcriptional regulator